MRKVFADYQMNLGRRHPKDERKAQPPEAGRYLFEWFWEISRGRGVADGGYRPISARDINDWCALRGVRLLPWETDAIFHLDNKFLAVIAEP